MNGMGQKTGDDDGGAFFGMVYSGDTRPRPIVHRPAVWLAGRLHRVAGWLWDWAERPAPGIPLTAEQLEERTVVLGDPVDFLGRQADRLPWPVTVYSDRYGGTYSAGDWLAAIGWAPLFDSPAFDGDVPCFEWWEDGGGARIGRGLSPAHAIDDLTRRWDEAGRPREFDWNDLPEQTDGPADVIDAEHAAGVRERSAIAREVLDSMGEDPADPGRWLAWPEGGQDIRFQWHPGHVIIFEGGADAEFLAERVNRPAPPERKGWA